jgi:hypothetical protein
MMSALTVEFILLFFMRKEGFVTRYSSIVGFYSAEIKLSTADTTLLIPCVFTSNYFKYSGDFHSMVNI